MNTGSLRAIEGYMTQETHLFSGTVGDNIALTKPDAAPEELMEACEKASLTGLIARLPQGLDTPVGELGDTLSGGERQRIGLARMFLHDAPFVLLDEPTSNLDSLNEAAVLRALLDAREGKTVGAGEPSCVNRCHLRCLLHRGARKVVVAERFENA